MLGSSRIQQQLRSEILLDTCAFVLISAPDGKVLNVKQSGVHSLCIMLQDCCVTESRTVLTAIGVSAFKYLG